MIKTDEHDKDINIDEMVMSFKTANSKEIYSSMVKTFERLFLAVVVSDEEFGVPPEDVIRTALRAPLNDVCSLVSVVIDIHEQGGIRR